MVLQTVGLPLDGILIAGVDRIFDMIRTSMNVTRRRVLRLWPHRWRAADTAGLVDGKAHIHHK